MGNNHLHNIFAWAVKETTGTMALMQFICAIFQTPVAISQKICLSLLQINLKVFCSPLNKFSLEHFESKCPFSFTKVKTSFPWCSLSNHRYEKRKKTLAWVACLCFKLCGQTFQFKSG